MGRRASVGGAQKSVAIKLIAARVASDERHRRMFLAEARLSMLMTHSNVVQVFDAGEDAGRLYLVMEWIDGLNLAQLCELRRRDGAGPWPPRMVGYLIGEVLRGLAYAHCLVHEGQLQCVVHRDVSPHNVLVSTSGEVKLADFGVARLAAEETSGLHIKGKLRYMAPEHLAGRSREPTVDLYGVGAVLHELLAGTRFRDEADEVDLYGQILGGHVPPLPVAGVPPELVSLREGLLQAEPRQRIPTAARALEYLAAWAGYRNAAGELGVLCRTAMGVVAPRSGIERSVDVHAETETPSVVTHTAGAATRQSELVPAVTRTSGAVPVAGSGRSSGPSQAAAPSRSIGRRALLVGAGIVGVGFSIGGVAVAWLRRSDRDGRRDEATASAAGAEPGPGPADVGGPATPGASIGNGPEPAQAAGSSDATTGAGGSPVVDGTTGATGPDDTTGEPIEAEAKADGAGGAAHEPRRKPTAPATVELRLRAPLRVAYVRIGRGPSFAVDPKVQRSVAAGRSTIWWRESPDVDWHDGGRFGFAAGGHYTVRLTKDGPVLE